jgi:glycosyltransferase involved in cell wall biosynthesis
MQISIALGTCNGATFLPEQLASYLQQKRLPDELVVCDDCSTDQTASILTAFARQASFPVRILQNESNLGSTRNFARALGQCRGDVIVLSDQDDVWLPDKLARIEQAFTDEPETALVFSDAWLVESDLSSRARRAWGNLPFSPAMQQLFRQGLGARALLRRNLVVGATAAFRASVLELALPIPLRWWHDSWIAFIAAATGRVVLIPEPLILYRQHPGQQVGIPRLSFLRQVGKALQKFDPEYFRAQAELFEVLHQRLQEHAARLCDPELLDWIAGKIRHARTQMQMRHRHRLSRIFLATGEWWRGHYSKFSHGWKSYAADVLLK